MFNNSVWSKGSSNFPTVYFNATPFAEVIHKVQNAAIKIYRAVYEAPPTLNK
jgi:hypothetical protein